MGSDFGSAFADIFEGIFGMGGAGARQQRGSGRERGADLRFNMEIKLEEAYEGKTAQIRLPTSVTCEACSGTGAKAGSHPKTCASCDGHGRVRAARQDGLRVLRDRSELFEGGDDVIKLGRHRFLVNTRALELTIVPKDGALPSRPPGRTSSGSPPTPE